MKIKTLIPIVTSAILAIVLVVMACTQAAAPSAPTPTTSQPPTASTPTPTSTPTPITQIVEKDKTYNCLNPQGDFIPVQTQSLAPRLDTLDGKTIYVVQGEADPVIMPALNDKLQKDYTKTTWVYYLPQSNFGATAPDDTTKKEAKAIIRGNGW